VSDATLRIPSQQEEENGSKLTIRLMWTKTTRFIKKKSYPADNITINHVP